MHSMQFLKNAFFFIISLTQKQNWPCVQITLKCWWKTKHIIYTTTLFLISYCLNMRVFEGVPVCACESDSLEHRTWSLIRLAWTFDRQSYFHLSYRLVAQGYFSYKKVWKLDLSIDLKWYLYFIITDHLLCTTQHRSWGYWGKM